MNHFSVLVTGAAGYLGRSLIKRLIQLKSEGLIQNLVATDIAETMPSFLSGADYEKWNICDEGFEKLLQKHNITTVIHLASIVNPRKDQGPEFCYQVDVIGTKQVLDACIIANVKHIVITSSGAAYGYYSDNPEWLKETDQIRGNKVFPYAYHKRLVEEMLTQYRDLHPELIQTVLRVGTILGKTTKNQITNLFEKPRLLGICGYKSPFVFIWDEDLVEILAQAVLKVKSGIYNVAGDGALSVNELASLLGKKVIWVHAALLRLILKVLHFLRLTQYDSEQVLFLQYRPVLNNDKLKNEFGYIPKKTSLQTFQYWMKEKLQ